MRVTVMAAVILAATSGIAYADCQSDTSDALAAVQEAIANGQSLDTCEAAKALATAYTNAASVLKQCNTKDEYGNDASKYEEGAKTAMASAGSC
jgi:hypothetical protein